MSGEFRYPANSLIRSDNFVQSQVLKSISETAFFPEVYYLTGSLTGSSNISNPELIKLQTLYPNHLSGTGSLGQPTLNIVNVFSGNLTGSSNTTANILQAFALIGQNLDGNSNATAVLTKVLNFQKDLTGSSNLVGTIEVAKFLYPNHLSGTGSLSNPSISINNNFSGNFNGSGQLNNAVLTTPTILNPNNLDGNSDATANLSKIFNLTGVISGSSDLFGNLGSTTFFNGNLTGSSNVTGDFYQSLLLNSNLTGSSAISGDLLLSNILNGNLNGQGLLNNAILESAIFLDGILTGSADVNGTISQAFYLNGNLTGSSNSSAALSITANEIYFSGYLTGSSNLYGESRIFKFAGLTDGLRKEKEIDIVVSQNGNLVSGSIFSIITLPKNTDGSYLVFVPFLNKSKTRSIMPPSTNFSVEIYVDSYLPSKMFAKVNFITTSDIGEIIPMDNWKNLESGEKLLYVSNQTFILESSYNDLTFGINLALAVCK